MKIKEKILKNMKTFIENDDNNNFNLLSENVWCMDLLDLYNRGKIEYDDPNTILKLIPNDKKIYIILDMTYNDKVNLKWKFWDLFEREKDNITFIMSSDEEYMVMENIFPTLPV